MKIKTHEDLEVYQIAFQAAMEIFKLSKTFPCEEKYSLTEQIRRSSRSVCANLDGRHKLPRSPRKSRPPEAWRKRRYKAAFIAKLSDSEAVLKDDAKDAPPGANPLGHMPWHTASHKAAEVQVWLKFAVECGYLEIDVGRNVYKDYNRILGSLVNIANNPDKWIL
ncbi:MAG TPA: four helix bundle protein [Coleofasciculaceae cyanobacterium]|jgi:hypothetical protein